MPAAVQKSSAPTSGQCGILAFFGKPVPSTGRQASIVIGELLADSFNLRRWTIERARRYTGNMELRTETSSLATYNVTRVLLHGFGLSVEEARPLLEEWNSRCPQPREARELDHKLRSTDAQVAQFPRGYLVGELPSHPSAATKKAAGVKPEREVRAKVEFDPKRLAAIAKPWRDVATLLFLANRSAVDPAAVDANYFLKLLYRGGEKVLVFTDYFSQGQAVWPDEAVPTTGKLGVWFLPSPVDGRYHANPRSTDKVGNARQSRRSEESVTAYRYILLESDKADARDWLGFIVQVPLCIDAIYTSGGRSIHALVRVDCATKGEWEARKKAMMPFLMGCVMMGGDRGVLSGVRLSRLPACWREGKEDAEGRYVRFPQPKAQKLLYVRPNSDERPICDMPALRDVESWWCARAAKMVDGYDAQSGEPASAFVVHALGFYANVSQACRTALTDLEGGT
jgi:hypothetical protein